MYSPNVALIGVNSRIGPALLTALLSSPARHTVTLLLRRSSKAPPASERVITVTLPDSPTLSELSATLKAHSIDVLICALPPALLDQQKRLADACVAAGVSRYVLADFGSCRSDDAVVVDLLPTFRNKRAIREHCVRLAEDHGEFSWTSIVSGHFFDYGLRTELLGLAVAKREATLFDGGHKTFSCTTTGQIGRAVAALVGSEERMGGTRNRMLLIESFGVSQLEVLGVVERVLRGSEGKRGGGGGGSARQGLKWGDGETQEKSAAVEDGTVLRRQRDSKGFERRDTPSRAFIDERIEGAAAGESVATEEMVAVLGILRSDWTGSRDLANGLLGLGEEDLEGVVRDVLRDVGEI